MNKTEKLISGVADYLLKDQDIESVEITITRLVRVTETTVRTKPKAEAPEPVPPPVVEATKPEPAVAPTPKRKPKTEATGKPHSLPDPDTPTRGRKYTDAEIARAKMLLRRGMRPREVSKATGIAYAQVKNLSVDRSRRAVPAAPDPRNA
jgi:outer membrane biosynthesis protein TonB